MKKKRTPIQHPVERHRLTFSILRLIRGRSATEVATKSGVCYGTVHNMRKPIEDGGTLAPRISVIDRIARAYGMKLQLVDVHEPRYVSARAQASNGHEARAN